MQGNHSHKAPTGAPLAAVRPQEHILHGTTRVDEYEWLQDAKNPEVLTHLKAENAYAKRAMPR